jgi:hypothetical protein
MNLWISSRALVCPSFSEEKTAAGFPCARYRMVFSWSAAAIEALTQFRNKCVFVQG